MKMIIFVLVSFVKKHQLASTLTSPDLPPFSYKIGLIKTLLHCAYEISSSWNFFDPETQAIKKLLMTSLYPSYLVDKEIKKFLDSKFASKENTNIVHNNKSISYYKLPYIGSYSNSTKKEIYELCKTFCKNTNVQCLKCFFTIQITGPISFKRLFANCCEVLCCVQIYLSRM